MRACRRAVWREVERALAKRVRRVAPAAEDRRVQLAGGADERPPSAISSHCAGERRLPSPLTREDLRAGYVYELAFRQFGVLLTQVLDRPGPGRIFFEQVMHDNLDIGRPDQISLIFDRRIIREAAATPGRFRTQVITDGVIPIAARRLQAHQDQAVPQLRREVARDE